MKVIRGAVKRSSTAFTPIPKNLDESFLTFFLYNSSVNSARLLVAFFTFILEAIVPAFISEKVIGVQLKIFSAHRACVKPSDLGRKT